MAAGRIAPVALSIVLGVAVAVAVAGCAADPTDRPSLSPHPTERRSIAPEDIPPSLVGRPLAIAEIGELELRVAVADTTDSRRRGLMGVEDFGAVEGMVFVFEAPTETGFYMKEVPVPLDIAFVAADGTVLEVLTMALCAAEPCPLYHSPAPFLWAVETPSGGLAGIATGDRFSLHR
jgi:uncharacterized protein